MRLSFVAHEGVMTVEFGTLICGVTNGDHYLMFQRAVEGSSEDGGIHLEYDDQSHSGYNCISRCCCSSDLLSVDLSRPLGNRRDITGIDVTLHLREDQLVAVRTGLEQIFRGDRELFASLQ